MIDPRIPMMGQQIDIGQIMSGVQRMKYNDAQIKQQEAQAARQERMDQREQQIGEVLPGALRGDQAAMDQLAPLNPELFMKLDDRQREAAAKELADVHSAVRWAQNPQQWEQVKAHYAGQIPGVENIPFEQREAILMQLGQMGEYLKSAPEMKTLSVEPGGSAIGYYPQTGETKVLVQPNMGGGQMGAPAGGPQPGSVVDGYRFKGGNPNDPNAWEEVTGSGQSSFR